MRRIALATCARFPELQSDFRRSLAAFESAGVRTNIETWDDPSVDWSSFDATVIQSTWDYFEKHEDFMAWVDEISEQTTLINSADVIRWNSDKRYLLDLQRLGVSIVPTDIVDDPSTFERPSIDAESFIIKPTISANSIDTFVVSPSELCDRIRTFKKPMMVQPFRSEIAQGELSVIYFNGARSHAVRKTPKSGDFRVQDGWGGTVTSGDDVDLALVDETAQNVCSRWDLAYVRIDGLFVDGVFEVMELEAIEPELFFRFSPNAGERYVKAILDRV